MSDKCAKLHITNVIRVSVALGVIQRNKEFLSIVTMCVRRLFLTINGLWNALLEKMRVGSTHKTRK